MDNNINDYRSSLVTAIWIILWFVLWFAANRSTQPTNITDWSDYIIAIWLFFSILFMTISLYRSLDNSIQKEYQSKYYNNTLKIFVLWIIFSFLWVLWSILKL